MGGWIMPRRTQDVKTSLEELCDGLIETDFESKILLLRKQQGCPLVEDIELDPDNKRVTFFYIGDGSKDEDVKICSYAFTSLLLDPKEISCSPEEKLLPVMPMPKFPMAKIEGTHIWVLSLDVPKEALFSYSINTQPDNTQPDIYDPLNPHSFGPSDDESRLRSVLDLSLSKIEPQTTSMSQIREEDRLKTYYIYDDNGEITDEPDPNRRQHERTFHVHFPPEYDPQRAEAYPLRLFLDGRWYLDGFEVPSLLDNEPGINIMLEPIVIHDDAMKDREYDYDVDPELSTVKENLRPDLNIDCFTEFLLGKFIPHVQQKFHVASEASKLTICGSSLSGFAAMYIGLQHPETFGNVLTQSASLWLDNEKLNGRLLKLLDTESFQNSCFYLETSKIEAPSIFSSNSEFDTAMTQQRIRHIFVKTCGEHGPAAWSQSLPGAVRSLQEERAELSPTTSPTPFSTRPRMRP